MNLIRRPTSLLLLLSVLLSVGCCKTVDVRKTEYEEIPSMLDILTHKVQRAVEQGYYEKGEHAIFEYARKKNPNIMEWFEKRGYELHVGLVGNYAVVIVCDKGKPVFEDTNCSAGPPDKDRRRDQDSQSCEITMTTEQVLGYCQETDL